MYFTKLNLTALFFIFTTLTACSNGLQSGSTLSTFGGVTTGQAISPTSVKLTWTKNDSIKEYKIYNSLNSAPIATTALDYYTIENLLPDTNYVFKVIGSDGTSTFGSDKEIQIKTWSRFQGITAVAVTTAGVVELSWDYDFTPASYQVFYQKTTAPTALSTNTWAVPNVTSSLKKVVITGLDNSTKYYFIVHATYRENEKEITTKVISTTTNTTFTTPIYVLDPISIGNLPSLSLTPVQDPKHSTPFFKSTVLWNGSPISDPLTGAGNIVFSSTANLPIGKLDNLSLKVDYNDGNSFESMTIEGLSTFIKGISPYIEKPPIMSLGNGASYMGKVLAAGDFNCDGADDLAVGLPDMSIASIGMRNPKSGVVLIYYSVLDSFTNRYSLRASPAPSWTPAQPGIDPQIITFDDLTQGANFGYSLSTGNLNGDRNGLHDCSDLIVGAPSSINPKSNRADGSAFVFFGSTKGLSAPSHLADVPENVATCNGDPAAAICSAVRLYEDKSLIPPALTGGSALKNLYSSNSWYRFGHAASFIGDFNGDGYDDIAIGAPYAPFDGLISGYSTQTGMIENVGAVFIYFGSKFGLGYEYPLASGAPSASDTKARYLKIYPPVPVAGMNFGWSIAGGADVDGLYKIKQADGTLAGGGDMVIGAPNFSYGDYLTNSPLKNNIHTTPDLAGIVAHSSGNDGWWKANSITLTNPTNYYGIPQNSTSVGAAFLYFGRGTNSASPSIETPSRQNFWQCGRRSLTANEHYSCLVSNSAVKMLSPRDGTTRGFGSAVALIGNKSRFKDNSSDLVTVVDANPAVPTKYFSDANGDGYADVIVSAPTTTVSGKVNVGVLWEFFGNPAKLFGTGDLFNVYADGTPVPSKDYKINDPQCATFASNTATTRQNCSPVILSSPSLSVSSLIGASQSQFSVGDVTGDGLGDLAVGAAGDNVIGVGSGSALVFTSVQGLGLSSNFKKIYTANADAGDALGTSVVLGNFNGDYRSQAPIAPTTAETTFPYFDLFAGAPNDEINRFGGGAVYGFLSAELALPSVRSNHDIILTESMASFQEFGLGETRLVGDLNGDGYADAVSKIKGTLSTGQVTYDAVIYYGSSVGLITTSFCLNNPLRVFGSSSDLTTCYPSVHPNTGTTLNDIQLPQLIKRPSNLDAQWAYMAVSSGDVNGDGFGDVLFIPYRGATIKNAVVYFGARGGVQNVVDPSWIPSSGDPQIVSGLILGNNLNVDDYSPESVQLRVPYITADFNGDGYADLAVGLSYESSPAMNTLTNPLMPRTDPGYPTGVTAGSGWACGGAAILECTGGTPVLGYGSVRIFYGSSRGYQTPRNNGMSNLDAAYGSPGVILGYDTETGTKPCSTSTAPDPTCSVTFLPNPVWENILYGYQKLNHAFGTSLAAVDVNKDGFPDLVVGAPGFEDLSCWSGANTSRNYGRAYIFYGGEFGIVASATTDYYSVDLTASCPVLPDQDPATGNSAGKSKVRALTPSLMTYGISNNDIGRGFGSRITSVGDVNNDTYEDLLIATPQESTPGLLQNGSMYLYYGPICPADNEFNVSQTFQQSDASSDNLNRQMYFSGQAPAGTSSTDVFSGTFSAAVGASCYRGNSSTMKPMPQKFYIFGANSDETWGESLYGGRPKKGDFNKDGYDDVVIGSENADDLGRGLTDIGKGVVFFGGPLGLFTADYPTTSVIKNSNGLYRPFSIMHTNFPSKSHFFKGNLSGGDINGDGSVDYLVPSIYYGGTGDATGINLGTFFLFY
jgi:hypothetical protein